MAVFGLCQNYFFSFVRALNEFLGVAMVCKYYVNQDIPPNRVTRARDCHRREMADRYLFSIVNDWFQGLVL